MVWFPEEWSCSLFSSEELEIVDPVDTYRPYSSEDFSPILDREWRERQKFIILLDEYFKTMIDHSETKDPNRSPAKKRIAKECRKAQKDGSQKALNLHPQILKDLLQNSDFLPFTREIIVKHDLIRKLKEIRNTLNKSR